MRSTRQRFSALTLKFTGRANRIISDVSVSLPFDPDQVPPDREFPRHHTRAIWDTGATNSFITPGTVNAVGLLPVGKAQIGHAVGHSEVNTYLVNLYLPNSVGVPGIQVSECADTDGSFGVIIGMDVIALGDFAITNVDGYTWMSFRVPPIEAIDYVDEANKMRYAGTGRNDPCPCGKTHNDRPVKYKHCHGKS